jgi:fatty acid desaturase
MLGSANITGGKLFHILTGNLSHQIEHHLYPDLPARRYPHIAAEVRAVAEKYGLDYNTGPLRKQLGSVAGKILRYAVPWTKDKSRADKLERRTSDIPAARAVTEPETTEELLAV